MSFDRRLLAPPGASRRLGVTIALGLAVAAVVAGQAFFLSRAIARVFLDGSGLAEVRLELFALAGLAVLRAGLVWMSEVAAQALASGVKETLRGELLGRLLELGPLYAKGEHTGELSNTLTEGVEALDAYLAQYLPQAVLAAAVPMLVLAIVLPTDPASAVVLVVTGPLIPLFMVLIGRRAKELNERQWRQLSRMSAHFLDVLQGLPTLKIFGRSREQIRTVAAVARRFRHTTLDVLKVAFLSALALEFLATISVAIVAVGVGLRLLYGRLPFDEALFVLVLAPEFFKPLRRLGASYHAGLAGREAVERIFEILATPSPMPTGGLVAPLDQGSTVAFDGVSFRYAEDRETVLRDVSFTLEPGTVTALVGPSGAGKSTVLQLLLGFARPDAGQITVDGTSLADLDLVRWREHLAWVPQLPYLLSATVADNLRLGRPEASPDELLEATKLAELHDVIAALPDGDATEIGERGGRLSGGEARRLALARAFLRDAPLVLLDEPTAHLDTENEARLERAVGRLARERTVLVVAHRLHTVRSADQILVLDHGEIVERGRHDSLLEKGGLYARLATRELS